MFTHIALLTGKISDFCGIYLCIYDFSHNYVVFTMAAILDFAFCQRHMYKKVCV